MLGTYFFTRRDRLSRATTLYSAFCVTDVLYCYIFLADLWPESNQDSLEPVAEPEWVTTEREHFVKYRDQDGDGFMNFDEVRHWISPPDYDHTSAEAKHLIYESDEDKVRA